MPVSPRYGVSYPDGTPLRVPKANKYGQLIPSVITGDELEYLEGATSLIQNQIDGKEDIIALTGNRAVISDGDGALDVSAVTAAELAALNALTASRALETSAGGLVQASDITAAELARLDGATEDIQPALDARLLLAGGAVTGPTTYAPGIGAAFTFAEFIAGLQLPSRSGTDLLEDFYTYSPHDWDETLVGSGVVYTSNKNRLVLKTGALNDDSTQIQYGGLNATAAGWMIHVNYTNAPLFFECSLYETATANPADDQDMLFGMCIRDTTLITAGGGPGQVSDGIFFTVTDGSADVSFTTMSGSSATTNSLSTNIIFANMERFGFALTYNGSWICTPYVNGVAGTPHTTNIPSGFALRPSFAVQAGSAALRNMVIGYFHVMQPYRWNE